MGAPCKNARLGVLVALLIVLLAGCGGAEESKQSVLDLSEARMRLKLQNEQVYQLEKRTLALTQALDANASATQTLAEERVEQAGQLTQLRSQKDVAEERLAEAKEPHFLRSQSEREEDIKEAASAVHAVREQIVDAELVLSQIRHRQQALDAKRYSISADLDKARSDLASAKELLPALERKVTLLEEEVKKETGEIPSTFQE